MAVEYFLGAAKGTPLNAGYPNLQDIPRLVVVGRRGHGRR